MKTFKLTKKQAINYYGSQSKVAAVLGISRQAVHKWPKYVPELSAVQLINLTEKQIIPEKSRPE